MTQGITSGQMDRIRQMTSDSTRKAAEEFSLDFEGAQNVIEVNGAEYTADAQRVLKDLLRRYSIVQTYADEELESSFTYPGEYTGPKSIDEQVKMLAGLLRLDPKHALTRVAAGLPELPSQAEGFFALPKLEAIARVHFKDVTDPAKQYCLAVELILKLIADSRTFCNYREGQITPNRLRQHAKAAHALSVLSKQQEGDILVVLAQFGLRHRGRSVRRARAVLSKREFGLGSLNVGSMLLTHPERLQRWEQLHVDCAGDEFAPDADGRFVRAPVFYFHDGEVRFRTDDVGHPDALCGSASGFLPQST